MDIRTGWDVEHSAGDWIASPSSGLEADGGLSTAVLLSLFTDRQAKADDAIPDGTGNRRGWWADPEMGSRLWLLSREKLTAKVAARAKEYCAEALQWLVSDGVAQSFDVAVEIVPPGTLGVRIVIAQPTGPVSLHYRWAWTGTR